LSRFGAAADAAVERGRRATEEANATGAAFQQESEALVVWLHEGGGTPPAR